MVKDRAKCSQLIAGEAFGCDVTPGGRGEVEGSSNALSVMLRGHAAFPSLNGAQIAAPAQQPINRSLKAWTEGSHQGTLWGGQLHRKHIRSLDSRADVPGDGGCWISGAAAGQRVVLLADDGTRRTCDV